MHILLKRFLLDRQTQGATPKTLEWHTFAVGKFIDWLGEEANAPETWTADTLRDYIAHLQGSPSRQGGTLSPRTVTNYTQAMLTFVRWLVEEGRIPSDITARVKKPRPTKDQPVPFSAKELRSLFEASKQSTEGLRDHAILYVLLDCGLRASEVCNLTRDDVLWEEQVIKVRQGKGRKDRLTPCSSATLAAIKTYLDLDHSGHETLFLARNNRPMTANGLLQVIRRIAQRAGVEDANPHRFRHTFATSFLRNGGDSLSLQRLMGHTTLTTTNRYVSLVIDDLQRAHDAASPVKHLLG